MALWCFGNKSQKDNRGRELPSVVTERKIEAASYNSEDHVEILTRAGSVRGKVLPYCVFNMGIAAILYYLMHYRDIPLGFSDKGHTFMSMLISFLVVTRSSLANTRYDEARDELNTIMRSCRELIQHSIIFSRHLTSSKAKEWRIDVARRTIVLLRTVVAVLEYRTSGEDVWKTAELTKHEKKALLMSVGRSNERSPMVLVMFLRSAIRSQKDFTKVEVNEELCLFGFVTDFVKSYHKLNKLISTPIPFPIVQMTRTFVFVWVFSFPFALVDDISSFPALLFLIFFITYGFMGLECVSIELDDPFGDDPCDFDVRGLAKVVAEDIYISLYDVDGVESAASLKSCMEVSSAQAMTDAQVKDKKYVDRKTDIEAWRSSVVVPLPQVGADQSQIMSKVKRKHHYQKSIDMFAPDGSMKDTSDIYSTISTGDLNFMNPKYNEQNPLLPKRDVEMIQEEIV